MPGHVKTRPGVRRLVASETLFVMMLWFLWQWNQERETNVACSDHRAASCSLSSGRGSPLVNEGHMLWGLSEVQAKVT